MKIFIFLFVSVTIFFSSQVCGFSYPCRGVDEGCEFGEAQQRHDCGWPGISQGECHVRGCCYDSKIEGVPWCFSKNKRMKCNFTTVGYNRTDCGWARMQPHVCRQRGCCWDSGIPDVPWCYTQDHVSP